MEGLKSIIDKLSQYNFLTNILPGTVLCIILKYFVGYDFITENKWYLQGVIFYFVGMVNNRFGSLVVEYLCKKIKLVNFSEYSDFVKAVQKDKKIEVLSMDNNVYRSYISVLLLVLIFTLYKWLSNQWPILGKYQLVILIVALLILFVMSYRKQAQYVKNRVMITLNINE